MPLVFSTIDCTENFNTRKESGDLQSGYQASVVLQVTAANKDALIADIIQNQRPAPWIGGSNPPKAKSFAVTPVTSNLPPNGQGYDYDYYDVQINYSNSVSTIVVEEIEPVVEFIRLDHRFFRWSSDEPLSEGEAPGFLYQSMNLTFKYFNKTSVPNEVVTGVGKVHNATWTSPTTGMVFTAETLLYCPGPLSNTYTTAGSPGYNYTTKFAFRPNGWNKFWRPKTQAWESIYLPNGTQYKSYPPTNLATILP